MESETNANTMREQDLLNNDPGTNNNKINAKSYSVRECHIVKRPEFDGYGFNLHSEKVKPGQYVGKVDSNSPAEAAGLREGDKIIAVNGVNIGTETHKQVVQRIKAISNEVRLCLLDPNPEVANNTGKSHINFADVNDGNTNNRLQCSGTPPLKSQTQTNATDVVSVAQDQETFLTSISMVCKKVESSGDMSPSSTDSAGSKSNVVQTNNNEKSLEATSKEARSTSPVLTANPGDIRHQSPIPNQTAPSLTNNGLDLNLTAAEMRAKLLAKKKFDPKNESVDLKKKFDIIQKL